MGVFVLGGAFIYLVSFTILSSIETSTDNLLEATFQDVKEKDNEP